ncbi:MAG TPA: response regulator transcription factor [Thermoanaerobaculia bacterium]|nr:response regulator transcription factor [Thermoanaerobaculia bacterium]
MKEPFGELVAVVEDEKNIRETVAFAVKREGYRVNSYADGAEAWSAFRQQLPDLAVLDILLPRMDGRELCRKLRSRSEALPIIFLTSKDEELDRVLGLELGADDYLCKPFSMRELMTRIKVLFRRAALAGDPSARDEAKMLRAGPLEIDGLRYTARWRGEALALTVTEFLLLQALARHPGHVKTRQQLLEEAYPNDAWVSERTIDSHVKRLRRKFEGHDAVFAGIDTVHGLGYRWVAGAES